MNNEEKILSMLEALTADMAAMKTDVAAEIAGVKTGLYSVSADTDKLKWQTLNIGNEMSGIKNGMYGLKAEMTVMRADVSELKTNMAGVKERLGNVETHLAKANENIRGLQQTVAGIEYEHGKKLDMIYEIVQGNTEKLTRIERDAARHEDSILHHIH